eukprot:CAMPEP_0204887718 /NCGR_PEP_ID=MMETSP1349-20130617/18626_1 /ASSEMBLY_ACC=CAM_ASM_000710 /TAXON_ID=215587 /ORGANISM="Aplanochytrium stocchinoi, Strain GSBS06" /LENGTH=128 /DNA_ID=CAMNT_0052050709 /DNA_START=235 /DNA_END=618 /DNA_ORIENTATION=+
MASILKFFLGGSRAPASPSPADAPQKQPYTIVLGTVLIAELTEVPNLRGPHYPGKPKLRVQLRLDEIVQEDRNKDSFNFSEAGEGIFTINVWQQELFECLKADDKVRLEYGGGTYNPMVYAVLMKPET